MRLFDWILETTWQASVLVLIILAVRSICKRRMPPKALYGLWLLLVARLMLPSLPESPSSIFNFVQPETLKTTPAPQTSVLYAHTDHSADPAGLNGLQPPTQPALVSTSAAFDQRPVSANTAPVSSKQLAFYIWILGACFFILRLTWSNVRFARSLAYSSPIADQSVLSTFEKCRQRLNITKPVLLLETSLVETPCVYGLWRKRLLLPGGFLSSFSAEELRDVFAHELAHIRRWDIEVNWITSLLHALHWFNPLLWLAFARMRADREIAADALALQSANDRSSEAYGETILKVLSGFTRKSGVPQLVGIIETKSGMRERLRAIARYNPVESYRALTVLISIAVACLTLTRAVEKENHDSTDSNIVESRAKPQPPAAPRIPEPPVPSFPKIVRQKLDRPAAEDEDHREFLKRMGVLHRVQSPEPVVIPAEIENLSVDELINQIRVDGPPGPYLVLEQLVRRHEDAIPFINGILAETKSDSPRHSTRQKSVNVLKYFCGRVSSTNSEKLVPALVPLLSDNNPQIRNDAAEALHKLGPNAHAAVPSLLKSAKNTPTALIALESIDGHTESTARAITSLLNDPTADLRFRSLVVEVCRTLIKKQGALVQDALLKAYPSGDWRLQRKIASAFLNFPQRSAAAQRIVLNTFKDPEQAYFTGKGEYMDLSVQQLTHYIREPRVPTEGATAVDELKYHFPKITDALPALISMLDDEQRADRVSAINAIGMMGLAGEPAIPSVLRLLYSDHPRHSEAMHGVIAVYVPSRHPKGKEILEQLLKHDNFEVRERAAWHLNHHYAGQADPHAPAPVRAF